MYFATKVKLDSEQSRPTHIGGDNETQDNGPNIWRESFQGNNPTRGPMVPLCSVLPYICSLGSADQHGYE